jgi:hypothetical protein
MSDHLEEVDLIEIRSRLSTILFEIDSLLKDVGPKVQKIGNLRLECSILYEELKRRGQGSLLVGAIPDVSGTTI